MALRRGGRYPQNARMAVLAILVGSYQVDVAWDEVRGGVVTTAARAQAESHGLCR